MVMEVEELILFVVLKKREKKNNYHLKFIFNINILKQFKNIKIINSKQK